MSKPWFLNIAMEAGSSPLAGAIAQVLLSEPTKESRSLGVGSAQGPGETQTPTRASH